MIAASPGGKGEGKAGTARVLMLAWEYPSALDGYSVLAQWPRFVPAWTVRDGTRRALYGAGVRFWALATGLMPTRCRTVVRRPALSVTRASRASESPGASTMPPR